MVQINGTTISQWNEEVKCSTKWIYDLPLWINFKWNWHIKKGSDLITPKVSYIPTTNFCEDWKSVQYIDASVIKLLTCWVRRYIRMDGLYTQTHTHEHTHTHIYMIAREMRIKYQKKIIFVYHAW